MSPGIVTLCPAAASPDEPQRRQPEALGYQGHTNASPGSWEASNEAMAWIVLRPRLPLVQRRRLLGTDPRRVWTWTAWVTFVSNVTHDPLLRC